MPLGLSLRFVPYAIWMALMMVLDRTAGTYAIRSVATLLALLAVGGVLFRAGFVKAPRMRDMIVAFLAGLVVWGVWVLPEYSEIYRKWFVIGGATASGDTSPYESAVCGWPLTIVRLLGSSFVIPAAEELFFRSWLYDWIRSKSGGHADRPDWGAFFWCTALFAIEHDRYLVGALAGAAYGILSLRLGLWSAIVAHSVTNLALGLQVILTGAWAFW